MTSFSYRHSTKTKVNNSLTFLEVLVMSTTNSFTNTNKENPDIPTDSNTTTHILIHQKCTLPWNEVNSNGCQLKMTTKISSLNKQLTNFQTKTSLKICHNEVKWNRFLPYLIRFTDTVNRILKKQNFVKFFQHKQYSQSQIEWDPPQVLRIPQNTLSKCPNSCISSTNRKIHNRIP